MPFKPSGSNSRSELNSILTSDGVIASDEKETGGFSGEVKTTVIFLPILSERLWFNVSSPNLLSEPIYFHEVSFHQKGQLPAVATVSDRS